MTGTREGTTGSREQELNLGKVDQVRVRVAFGPMLDGPPRDVFLLDVPVPTDDDFVEQPYLEAAEPILSAGAQASHDYSVHLTRHHSTMRAAAGEAELRLSLATAGLSRRLPLPVVEAVAAAFRQVLDHAGTPARELQHDEAIALAMVRVEDAYPHVHSDTLSVSDEQHHHDRGSWSIGLRTKDLDRYVVVLGFIDGYAGSAHVRHEPRSEVLDSVGSERA